jgi:hypothetical protein
MSMKSLSQVLDEVLVEIAVRQAEITLDECPPDLRERIEAARQAARDGGGE